MQYTRVSKGSGHKYAIGSSVIANIASEITKKYLKCDICKTTGYIEGDIFVEVKQYTQHQSMAEEIQRLQLLERCRKRPTESLRRIFDTETQSIGNAAGASVAFADTESSMYKRRRRQLPILLTDDNVAPRITGIHFEMCNGQANSFFVDHCH